MPLAVINMRLPTVNRPDRKSTLRVARVTSASPDIDVDASGRMYVASWHGGKFAYSGPNVGFVVQVVPEDFKPEPFPDVTKIDDAALFDLLIGPSQQQNLHAQFELLRRGYNAARTAKLNSLAADKAVRAALEPRRKGSNCACRFCWWLGPMSRSNRAASSILVTFGKGSGLKSSGTTCTTKPTFGPL